MPSSTRSIESFDRAARLLENAFFLDEDRILRERLQAMRKLARRLPHLHALADRVENRTNVAAYLASPRRLAFSTQGIFRHYPELDG